MSADADADQTWKYVCPGCQTVVNRETGETRSVDKVRDGVNTRDTAEVLASIHSTLNNGHDPQVMQDG